MKYTVFVHTKNYKSYIGQYNFNLMVDVIDFVKIQLLKEYNCDIKINR